MRIAADIAMCMGWCRGSTLALRRELSSVSCNVSQYDLDRMHIETSAASFTSFNSEEGFGSPAAHRNKDRPNVFDMDDNDLKVQTGLALQGTPCALWSCSVVPEMLCSEHNLCKFFKATMRG